MSSRPKDENPISTSLPNRFVDWLQRKQVLYLGSWMLIIGLSPLVLIFRFHRDEIQAGTIIFTDYLAIAWFFFWGGGMGIVSAIKQVFPGMVTLYGRSARILGGMVALGSWSFSAYFLYLGLRQLLTAK
jgi:hypothetical protein